MDSAELRMAPVRVAPVTSLQAGRPTRGVVRAGLCVALLALVGCQTVSDREIKTGGNQGSAAVKTDATSTAQLLELDRLVDRYLADLGRPGVEAQRDRAIRRPAIEARVAALIEDLLKLASSPEEGVRRHVAVKALGFSDDPRAPMALVATLGNPTDARMLTLSTFSLSRIRSADTPTERLVDLIAHVDADVRNNSILALWHVMEARLAAGRSPLPPLGADRARSYLEVTLFEPEDPYIRGHSAAALGALGDARSVDPLLNLLRDPHAFVRTHTSLALGNLGDPRAIPSLVERIDETDKGTPRSAVVAALSMLIEASGRAVPEGLGDNQRAWRAFIERGGGR